MDKKSVIAAMAMVGVTGSPVPPGLRGNDPRMVILDDLYPTPTGRLTHTDPQIQYLDYNPVTNQVEVEEVSQETFFNVDYSDIENRIHSYNMNDNPNIYMQLFDYQPIEPKKIDMFDIPFLKYGFYPGFDFPFEDRASYPVPNQKWVRSRSKYHEPRSAFLAKVKRKRNLNKANRKRARHHG